jgi:hypothetical protein
VEQKDRAKLNPPEPFEGKATTNVLTWLIGMESYLFGCNTPKERWPVVASTYLRESAKDWYHSIFIASQGVLTWEEFKASMIARFRPVDSNRICRAQLMDLKMRPTDKGRAVLHYVNRFNQLVNQVSDITDTEKFMYFNKGLTAELQKLLIPLPHINKVEDAISMVIRYEMLSQVQDSNRTQSNGSRASYNNRAFAPLPSAWSGQGKSPSYSSSDTSSAPMELGSLNIGETDGEVAATAAESDQLHALRSERLSQEQLEQHMRRGLCFNCHKPGHRSRECPLKVAARK